MARKTRFEDIPDDLNLVPIMGLIVILIPMLLLMVVFTHIGVININAPKLSVGPATEEPQEDDKKPLNLTIGISEKGFTIAATGGVLPGQEPGAEGAEPAAVATGPTIPSEEGGTCDQGVEQGDLCREGNVCPKQCGNGNICKGNRCLAWNFVALYNRMIEIKDAYPDEHLVNIGADDKIHYGTLVTTMDAIRLRLTDDKYDSIQKFGDAKAKRDKDDLPVLLFNDVVMAIIQ